MTGPRNGFRRRGVLSAHFPHRGLCFRRECFCIASRLALGVAGEEPKVAAGDAKSWSR
jgi:hypothetical protein